MFNQKRTGIAIIVFSAALFIAILLESLAYQAVNIIVHTGCNLPDGVCPASALLPYESYIPLIISVLLGIFGTYMIHSSRQPAIRAKPAPSGMADDESMVYSLLAKSGAMLQSDLVQKSGIQKVRMTRILDKLEAKQLVERQRRGMTNLVKLKSE